MNRLKIISSEEAPFKSDLQSRIEEKGLEIFERIRGEAPRVFSPRNLTGQLMNWSMQDELLKTQLFRFVDVLPSLGTSRQVAQHACEYLCGGPAAKLPTPIQWIVKLSPQLPWPAAFLARESVAQMAKTFILARSGAEAIPKLAKLRRRRLAFTADVLGETVVSEREADQYQARYLELIDSLVDASANWPCLEQIDHDDRGELPKVNVSIKLSALYSQIHPTNPEGAIEHLSNRLTALLRRARERGVFINFDMEHTALKPLTFELFKRLLSNAELRDYPHFGVALQAYLREAEQDFDDLLAWLKAGDRRCTIRLIKGAYWDFETIQARQRGWPVPVFEHKWETDAAYERIARRMLENSQWIDSAFGTHNIRSIAACLAHAEDLGRPKNSFELQMLFGMAEPIKRALVGMDYRVRDYCPIGELLPGMSYLVRRLLENTSNEGFLRSTFAEHVNPRELLRDPIESGAHDNAGPILTPGLSAPESRETESEKPEAHFAKRASLPPSLSSFPSLHNGAESRGDEATSNTPPITLPLFDNEPLTDFTLAKNRERMRSALEKVRGQFGSKFAVVINGEQVWTPNEILSINPARPSEVVGRVAKAGIAQADAAIAAARSASSGWGRSSAAERARVVEGLAELLHQERFELAALEVFETGKTWPEADADVVEAIDFCHFYAHEMRRIAAARYVIPGEVNVHDYVPRGVALVIAPWNFPLAILCGMTTASLVTGNSVILKPSEQSSVVAAHFFELLQRAGVPPGVINFLPGAGSEIGAYLVEHPDVDLIAFTGSREVGLKIWEAAGKTRPGQRQLKKVICEMGGKNAVIIDSDADLDEAIPAILHSAFGYQGQKCSALSRLIVLADVYDRLLERLIAATGDLQIGMPEHPGTVIGPLIDREAFKRVRNYVELGKQEAKLVFAGTVPKGEGYFVAPTIFAEVAPEARIAQEEIFGPVLCVLKAPDLDQAIAWAKSTQYALTGGFFSRSPTNIERVKAELLVGNLYINRGITGAIVARHPFGGFKMSGSGTKAGGRDYLLHFMFPRVITENVMRHGFAPEMSTGPLGCE